MVKLSIIVPVYNTSIYLNRCINSIYKQGILESEFQVVAINDGSTDFSLDILQEWQRLKSNFIVVSQSNQGLSEARNLGLKIASGKYVQFLDSDDWLVENSIKLLLEVCLNSDLDILGFEKQMSDGVSFMPNIRRNAKFVDRVFNGSWLLRNAIIQAPATKFMIKSDLLKREKIYFYPSIFHEDEEFTPRLFIHASRCMLTQVICYNHYMRNDSITHNQLFREKAFDDILFVIKNMNILSNQINLSADQRRGLKCRNNQLISDIYFMISGSIKKRSKFIEFSSFLKSNNIRYSLSKNLTLLGKVTWLLSSSYYLFQLLYFFVLVKHYYFMLKKLI